MAVLAHPDDESLGVGETLARYASEGVSVSLITATRGERGRNGTSRETPPEMLATLREAELRAAAEVLGIREVCLLDCRMERSIVQTPAPSSAALPATSAASSLMSSLHSGRRAPTDTPITSRSRSYTTAALVEAAAHTASRSCTMWPGARESGMLTRRP